jgi:hypothetical protein
VIGDWFRLGRAGGRWAGHHPSGAFKLLVVVAGAVWFLSATNACDSMPVCERPNDLRACPRSDVTEPAR